MKDAIQHEAAILRLLILADALLIENVIQWADRLIMKLREPSDKLLDLSLARTKSKYEVADILGQLENEITNDLIAQLKPYQPLATQLHHKLFLDE